MANPDSTVEVIEALEAALKADAGVVALVSQRVFDRVPDAATMQAVMPLIAIGDVLGQPAIETVDVNEDGETDDGFELSVTIEVWSATRSRREAAQIMLAMSNRLRKGLTLATKTVVDMQMADQRIRPIEGDQYAFGFQRWRILTDS